MTRSVSFIRKLNSPNLYYIIIACMLVALFYRLGTVPYGFYIDEAAGIISAICISENGTGAWQDGLFPLSFQSDTSGVHSPIFVYFNAIWGLVFGFSIASVRAVAAVFTIGTAVFTSLWVKRYFGTPAMLICLVLCLISPWAFQFSRIAWMSYMFPFFSMGGVYAFSCLKGRQRIFLAALFFAASMYVYGSARVQVPLLLFGVAALSLLCKEVSKKDIALTFVAFTVLCLPLLYALIFDNLAARAQHVGIFGQTFRAENNISHVLQLVPIFFQNVVKHLSPKFLFLEGDMINLRHGSQEMGQLSWLETLGLLLLPVAIVIEYSRHRMLAYRNPDKRFLLPFLLLFLFWGVFASIAPSALTWDSLPHALRSSGVWPFSCALASASLSLVAWRFKKVHILFFAVALMCMTQLLYVYFWIYPEKSMAWFDYHIYETAKQAAETNDLSELYAQPDYLYSTKRYFQHEVGGVLCSSYRAAKNTEENAAVEE